MARNLTGDDIAKRWEPLVSDRIDPAARAQHAAQLLGVVQHLSNWLQAVRNRAVNEALDAGVPGVQLAERTGLTKSMISKIAGERLREMLPDAPGNIFDPDNTGHVRYLHPH